MPVVSDMRALRAISTHKLFLSKLSFQNPTFSRHFHSSTRLHRPQEPTSAADSLKTQNDSSSDGSTRSVWTVFGTPVAQRAGNKASNGPAPRSEDEGESESKMGSSESFENQVKEVEKDNSGKKGNLGKSSYFGDIVRSKKKKGKVKTSWVCSSCGEEYGQWWGACRSCREAGSLKRFSESDDSDVGGGGGGGGYEVSEKAVRSWVEGAGEVGPMRLTDVNQGVNWIERRIRLPGLFGSEVERVLGGGVVPGSLVLVGGDPGVGKSTLVLQMAALIAEGHGLGKSTPVVYVSGEESVDQIGSRADRMDIETEDLYLYSSTEIEDILEKSLSLKPQALIVDSIQTVYLKKESGSAGGQIQVKECTSALLRFAKKTNIPVILIGHVTKSGDIAGPKVLEHIVDVVLYMEGEKNLSHRLLRSVKNRFGSTDELGVFEMSQSGLQVVANPSGMYLSQQYLDSEFLAGLAVAVIMDGSRTFLIEIQALCVSDSRVSRQFNGVLAGRAEMIISVLAKQAGLKLQENAVFLNVVSGVAMKETAGDLAIAAAICSSFLEFPIPNSIAFIGEIGLGGELRSVTRMDKRIHTVAKLGYKKCIVPKSAETSRGTPSLESCEDIEIVGCKDLKEFISNVFKR